MTLKPKVGLAWLRYQGGGPMLAWLLHRISGLGMIVFIGLHVLASFAYQQTGSSLGRLVDDIFENNWFQIFIFFCVIFHTLNGLRIIILDTWPKLIQYQREITWLQWLIFLPIYGLALYFLIQRGLGLGG
jgi:succinate dehydrogenase / fumarate reductase cytochrome b subunit